MDDFLVHLFHWRTSKYRCSCFRLAYLPVVRPSFSNKLGTKKIKSRIINHHQSPFWCPSLLVDLQLNALDCCKGTARVIQYYCSNILVRSKGITEQRRCEWIGFRRILEFNTVQYSAVLPIASNGGGWPILRFGCGGSIGYGGTRGHHRRKRKCNNNNNNGGSRNKNVIRVVRKQAKER